MIAFFLTAIVPRSADALDPFKHMRQYVSQAWSTEQGLPQITVQALGQSPDGYLWIGTQDGLARFDGVRFSVFDKTNVPGMKANDIRDLHIDPVGVVWLGSNGGGLLRYDGEKFRSYTVEDGLINDKVFCMAQSPSGELLVGTVGGLSVLSGDVFANYTTEQGLPHDAIEDIFVDSQNRIWLATGKGLARYDKGKVEPAPELPDLADKGIKSLYEDRQGRLWFGSWGHGLFRWDEENIVAYGKDQGVSNLMISDMVQDRDGNFFVATFGGGLLRLEGDGFVSFTEADGLSKDGLLRLLEDREGNLWIGTESAGLFLLRDGKFTSYSSQDGLPEPSVRTIFEETSGALWLGLQAKGISRFRDGIIESFGPADGVPDSGIRGMLEDSQGRVWIGTYNEGVILYENNNFVRPQALAKMPLGSIRAIEEDLDGNLWFAVYGKGLVQLSKTPQGPVLRQISEQDGLASNQVLFVKRDRDGALWVGAWGNGITRYRDGKFKVYTTKDGLGHDVVLSMHQDEDGYYWFGTYGGGLIHLRDDKISNITKRDGLFEDVVYVILPDGLGNLWMSCNKGVFRANRRQLLDFADGKIERVESVHYDESDGMRQRDCAGGSSPAGARAKDGKLWFPTVDGFTGIDPSRMRINEAPPPLLLEGLLVNGKTLSVNSGLRIEPGADKLELHYTSPSFISPEKIVFQYMLEGFDPEFVDAETRRIAYYTNLNPGSYRFWVKARNADGVWSQGVELASFELLPAYYQTLWFRLLCILSFVAIVFAIARIRLERVKRQNVLLEQKVKDRTAQLEAAHVRIVQLEKENTEKQMAGGFAHEVRNSLAGAKMLINKILCVDPMAEASKSQYSLNSERLLELFKVAKADLPTGSVQKVAAMVKEIHEAEKNMGLLTSKALGSIERSLDVTSLIMDYAKIGASSMGDSAIDLKELISSVIEDQKYDLDDAGIEVELQVPHGLELTGTPSHFRSVFGNLVSNAKDALAGPRRRSDEPRRLRVTATRDAGAMQIEVWDNGEGIPKANLQRIFDPFFSTKPDTGTGLGLGVVNKYLSLYNGELTVDSDEGYSTTFTVVLPISALPESSKGETHGSQ